MNRTKNNYIVGINDLSATAQVENTKTEALYVAAMLLNDDDCKSVTITKIEAKKGEGNE